MIEITAKLTGGKVRVKRHDNGVVTGTEWAVVHLVEIAEIIRDVGMVPGPRYTPDTYMSDDAAFYFLCLEVFSDVSITDGELPPLPEGTGGGHTIGDHGMDAALAFALLAAALAVGLSVELVFWFMSGPPGG